jgi:hypothetical protein
MRRALAAALALALLVLPGAGVPAAAAQAGQRAALIVQVGQTVRRLCVGLASQPVSGKQLLEATGLQQRWDGGALCRLAGTGPAAGDCFASYPLFWGYWIGDGRGGWTWSSAGAASSTARPGSVQAWVWSTGADESSHRRPPALRFADVCAPDGPAPGATAVGAGAPAGGGSAQDQGRGATARQEGPASGGGLAAPLLGGALALLAALGLLALAWRRRRGA